MPTLQSAKTFPTMRADLDSQISVLEAQISTLANQVRRLKTQRNNLADISKIPDEILCDVFALYKQGILPPHIKDHSTRWSIVTVVCSRWRNIALQNAQLWSDIDASDSWAWITRKLERSKSTPLGLYFGDVGKYEDGQVSLLQATVSQPSRLRALSINGNIAGLHKLADVIPSSAPHLEELAIAAYVFGREPEPAFNLPSTLLSGGTPRLRKLRVTGYNLPWKSPPFRNLIALQLSPSGGNVSKHPLEDVLGALRNMPRLEILDLCDNLPSINLSSSITYPFVTLPHLRDLILYEKHQNYMPLLDQIAFPASTCVRISFPNPTDKSVSTMASISSSWLSHSTLFIPPGTTPPRFETMLFLPSFGGDWGEVRLSTCYYDTLPRYDVAKGGTIRFPISEIAEEHLPSLASHLSLHGIRSLIILEDSPHGDTWPRVDWGNVTPLLQSITLGGSISAEDMMKYLGQDQLGPPSGSANSEAAHVLLPRLASITLRGVAFNHWYGDDGIRYGANESEFIDLLAQRAELGVPIQVLRLKRCRYLRPESLARLKEIVPSVIGGEIDPQDEF